MASNTQDAEGYDCQWLKDPPDSLKCVICLLVVREPQQHGDCGRVFCNSCITEYKKKKDTCPYCRGELTTFKDGRSTLEVKSLEVQCDNEECTWQGELRSLPEHLLSCEYILVDCPNKCDIEKLVRKDLKVHLESECLKRDYTCPHCEEEGEYDEMTTTHLEECPDIKIKCLNTGCEAKIPRCEISAHQITCAYEPVSCKYAEFGCEERPLHKDLTIHEEDVSLHFPMTLDKVLELNKQVAKLNTTLHAKIMTLENKMLDASLCRFKVHRFRRREVQSSSFYTSCKRYKMGLEVYANGIRAGEGTHVSVYAHLMKGDNDDSLTWPFTGTVTLELLNQLKDKNHHKQTVTFPADKENSKRVVDRERGTGWGKPQFISHAKLDHQSDKNCQYLKDDTLIFRVSVQVPDHKPWLECTR